MKKLFYLLTTLLLTSPFKSGILSKKDDKKSLNAKDVLSIGIDIDKTKAKDSSGKYKYGVTNFFVIGDSLSDVDGLTTYIKDRFQKINLNINLIMDGDAYGFDEDAIHHNSFTNGPTAAFYVAKKLGLKSFDSSNMYASEKDFYGKNYAVAGATAGKIKSPSGLLLNSVRVDKQTKALISQHTIKSTDVVFFEIGGNDLAKLVKLENDKKNREDFLQDSINRIKIAFFTLLNNGVKKIIFMTPPRIDFPPNFQDIFTSKDKLENQTNILKICNEFHSKIKGVLEEIKAFYPDHVVLYDLYENTDKIQHAWLKKKWFKNKKIAKQNLQISPTEWEDIKIEIKIGANIIKFETLGELTKKLPQIIRTAKQNNREINISVESGKIENANNKTNYFFVDKLHPEKKVHEIVGKIILRKIKKITKKSKFPF